MWRRVPHFLQIISLTVIGLLSWLLYAQQHSSQKASSTTPKLSQAELVKKLGFTTIIDPATDTPVASVQSLAKTSNAQPFKPTHSSDILAQVEFEQHQYIAFLTPNDTYYPLWHLTNINAPSAWDITTGNSQIVVAVVDSGFALAHQDLNASWYINQAEQGTTKAGDTCWTGSPVNKQTNNCDDDDNGYVDDWRGWDFYDIDNDPQAGDLNPTGSGVTHATNVAGLIAATADNGLGLPGVDWQAKIMPLQALSDNGTGYTSDIVAAIEYAVDNGADVINLSLGGSADDPALEAAIDFAASQNVVVVAASGNCASLAYDFCNQLEAPGYLTYPAKYDNLIAVGAVNSAGVRASFSSYGPELDLVAPGSGITTSTSWSLANQTSLYSGAISGTSFSSPVAAGAISLLKGYQPNLNLEDIRYLLTSTASRAGNFSPDYGYGQIDILAALELLNTDLADTLGRSSRALQISSVAGENPASPLASSQTTHFIITANPGDQVSVTARNLNTNAKKTFSAIKVDETGEYQYSWDTSFLGVGVWRLTPSSLSSSGSSETIYIN
ncbi:S8 family serine peptidase [Candidatus Saccharibacteria bacterium]|nr:S8 family serine peptidase [Candidatus Saccharibacteria bacterium]MCB9821481.1 S8 family serine peptidase [Candidatus Nomurabacteria bacterium]